MNRTLSVMRACMIKSFLVCLTLCTPMDYCLPGSVHGILQARILEWVATPSSRGSSHPGIETASPALEGKLLATEPPGSPEDKLPKQKVRVVLNIEPYTFLVYYLTFVIIRFMGNKLKQ